MPGSCRTSRAWNSRTRRSRWPRCGPARARSRRRGRRVGRAFCRARAGRPAAALGGLVARVAPVVTASRLWRRGLLERENRPCGRPVLQLSAADPETLSARRVRWRVTAHVPAGVLRVAWLRERSIPRRYPSRSTGRPASRHPRKPPITSVVRVRPSSCSVAAARLD